MLIHRNNKSEHIYKQVKCALKLHIWSSFRYRKLFCFMYQFSIMNFQLSISLLYRKKQDINPYPANVEYMVSS